MVKSRRAVFFTITSILFIAALMILFNLNLTSPPDTGAFVVQAADSYRERLEDVYLPVVIEQTSYQTLRSLSDDGYATSRYLLLPDDYETAIVTGTARGHTLTTLTTLPQAFSNLSAASDAIGYNLTLTLNDITVAQTGAFQAAYAANVTYELHTQDNSVAFNRTLIIQDTFSLFGIGDLYYNAEAQSSFGSFEYRRVRGYTSTGWDNANFTAFATAGAYSTNNESPSLFNRLQGNTAASVYGIETMIPITQIPAGNLTSVDWEYFMDTDYSCTYDHAGLYPAFRASISTLVDYNITGATLFSGSSSCPAAP